MNSQDEQEIEARDRHAEHGSSDGTKQRAYHKQRLQDGHLLKARDGSLNADTHVTADSYNAGCTEGNFFIAEDKMSSVFYCTTACIAGRLDLVQHLQRPLSYTTHPSVSLAFS